MDTVTESCQVDCVPATVSRTDPLGLADVVLMSDEHVDGRTRGRLPHQPWHDPHPPIQRSPRYAPQTEEQPALAARRLLRCLTLAQGDVRVNEILTSNKLWN